MQIVSIHRLFLWCGDEASRIWFFLLNQNTRNKANLMPNFNLGIGNWDETLKKDLSKIY
ncbi:hypothetical protein BGP_3974 [Beggiatoa sp. PS]|nr:hypothetical protein BGP_3974 [Beggiatoa sp. PS]